MKSVGARVRALAPAREKVHRWRRLSLLIDRADVGGDVAAVIRRGAWIEAGAVAGGGMFLGFFGAIAAPVAVGFGLVVWLRRRAASRVQRMSAAFPEAVRGIGDGLRSGLNLSQALELVAADTAPPLATELARIVAEVRGGRPVAAALGEFSARWPVPGADLLSLAATVAARSGAEMAPILEGIVVSARDRERLQREMHAATAQGRLTAIVVAGLPVAFLAIMGGGAKGEVHLLLHEPIGWGLLAVGGVLDGLGFAWMRRMVRRP